MNKATVLRRCKSLISKRGYLLERESLSHKFVFRKCKSLGDPWEDVHSRVWEIIPGRTTTTTSVMSKNESGMPSAMTVTVKMAVT